MRRRNREEDGWEAVMVQITFGFVIILGYLLSDGNRQVDELKTTVESLDAEVQQAASKTERWQSAYQEIVDTPAGTLAKQRDQALEDLQLERLLRIWDEIREERPFRRTLHSVRDGHAAIELADDADALPQGTQFETIQQGAEQLFTATAGSVSQQAINSLMEDVQKRFDGSQQPEGEPLRSTAGPQDVPFNTRVVTQRNLERLQQVIHENLLQERALLVTIQLRLVRDIMNARVDWLARRSDAITSEPLPAGDLSGMQQLLRIIDQLQVQMRLLDETRFAVTRPAAESLP